MRQGQSGKRSRGNRRNNNSSSRTVDSNGPEVKIRGTISHVYEKYQALAREANIAGERIASESYMQHAEHYYRLMNQAAAGNGQSNRQNAPNDGQQQNQVQNQTQPSSGGNGAADKDGQDDASKADGRNGSSESGPTETSGRRRRRRGRRPASNRPNTETPAAEAAVSDSLPAATKKSNETADGDETSASQAGKKEASAPDEA